MLTAAQLDDWFVEKTEPRSSKYYKPLSTIEEMMDQFLCQGRYLKVRGSA